MSSLTRDFWSKFAFLGRHIKNIFKIKTFPICCFIFLREASSCDDLPNIGQSVLDGQSCDKLFSFLLLNEQLNWDGNSSDMIKKEKSDLCRLLFCLHLSCRGFVTSFWTRSRPSLIISIPRPSIYFPSVTVFGGSPLTAFHLVSESIVREVLNKTAIKTCELDPLPSWLLAELIDDLLPFFTSVINDSFDRQLSFCVQIRRCQAAAEKTLSWRWKCKEL